jgi:transketolase
MKKLIRRVIEIAVAHRAIGGHGHIGSSLSALPIILDIYRDMERSDVFILSKGHAVAAWIAVLESHGYTPNPMQVHPDRSPKAGIPCTTGSLGHGLPMAAGIAYAKKVSGKQGKVHVLLGDGECLEGTTWESLNVANRFRLDNLWVHVDANGWQGSCAALDPLLPYQMEQIFNVQIYNRKKGCGLSLFASHPEWHTHFLTDDEVAQIEKELNEK